MNLNELWSGYDYAYYQMKGRNEPFRMNARRVKVIRVYKKQLMYNTRASGFAEVMLVDRETGEPVLNDNGEQRVFEVRARDLEMRWDEYWDIYEHRVVEREQIAKQEEEREARMHENRTKLVELMQTKFTIDPSWVDNITDHAIRLNRRAVEEYLGIKYNGGEV